MGDRGGGGLGSMVCYGLPVKGVAKEEVGFKLNALVFGHSVHAPSTVLQWSQKKAIYTQSIYCVHIVRATSHVSFQRWVGIWQVPILLYCQIFTQIVRQVC